MSLFDTGLAGKIIPPAPIEGELFSGTSSGRTLSPVTESLLNTLAKSRIEGSSSPGKSDTDATESTGIRPTTVSQTFTSESVAESSESTAAATTPTHAENPTQTIVRLIESHFTNIPIAVLLLIVAAFVFAIYWTDNSRGLLDSWSGISWFGIKSLLILAIGGLLMVPLALLLKNTVRAFWTAIAGIVVFLASVVGLLAFSRFQNGVKAAPDSVKQTDKSDGVSPVERAD